MLDPAAKKQYKARVLQTSLVQAALLIKRPSTWLCLLIASAIWPIAILFSPLAATLADARATSLAKEVAFVSALLVLAFGERRYTEQGWLLLRLSNGRRIAHGIATRSLHAWVVGMVALIPATLLGGNIGPEAYLKLALSSGHLAAAYVFLSSLGLATTNRSVLVTFLALAIPATNQGDGVVAQSLHALLDPRVLTLENASIWALSGAQLMSIAIIAVLSTCFDLRASR